MKYREFIEKEKVGDMIEWFLPSKTFENDVKFHGWKILEAKPLHEYHADFNDIDVVCTNPNFYEDGHVLAESRRSIIQASGWLKFEFNGKEYSEIYEWFKDNKLSDLKNINWIEGKDWIIVTKKSNDLLGQFDDWDNCPMRKEVE